MICKLCKTEQPAEQFPRFMGSNRRRKVCRRCSGMDAHTSDHRWYLTIPFKQLIMLNKSYSPEDNAKRYDKALRVARKCVGQFHARNLRTNHKGEHHV